VSVFRDGMMQGKVALVTGGATGIGKEIARSLGGQGARIAIASRKREALEAAAAELGEEGIEVFFDTCDVREPEQVERVIAGLLDRFGRLDILVNNAAGNFPAFMSNISYKGFRTIVDIDLLGTYNVSKAAYEAWLKEHGGNIVNISAPFEGMGVALQAHVAAAKTGVDSLTRTAAVEWGPQGIRVNAVAPGEIEATEGVARFDAAADLPPANNPLGRRGTRQDIANAVLFLVSDAASFISGQVIAVDGATSVDMLKLGPAGG
jgi:peroxisomal 2,4-dienoyl-CoA reductase